MGKRIKIKAEGLIRSVDEAKEHILPTMVGAGVRGLGAIAGTASVATLENNFTTFKPMAAPLVFLVGVVAEAFSDNEYLSKGLQGISTSAFTKYVLENVPTLNSIAKQGFHGIPTVTPRTAGGTAGIGSMLAAIQNMAQPQRRPVTQTSRPIGQTPII